MDQRATMNYNNECIVAGPGAMLRSGDAAIGWQHRSPAPARLHGNRLLWSALVNLTANLLASLSCPTLQLQFQLSLLFKCPMREYYNAIFMFEFKTVNSTAMGTVGSSGSLSMYIGATVNLCIFFYKMYLFLTRNFWYFTVFM